MARMTINLLDQEENARELAVATGMSVSAILRWAVSELHGSGAALDAADANLSLRAQIQRELNVRGSNLHAWTEQQAMSHNVLNNVLWAVDVEERTSFAAGSQSQNALEALCRDFADVLRAYDVSGT